MAVGANRNRANRNHKTGRPRGLASGSTPGGPGRCYVQRSLSEYHSVSVHSFHTAGIIGSIIGAWVLLLPLRLLHLEPGRR